MITAVPSGGAQDEAYVAITSCSGALVPKFDSKLEIQSPEQGGMILLFLTAFAVFPCVHCGQSAKTPALVPGPLVCYQIWVTRQVIATSALSWAYLIQRSKKWLVCGLVKFAIAVPSQPAWVVFITFCKPFFRALYYYYSIPCIP